MIFRSRRGRVLVDTDFIIDCIKIELVDKTKFLGVIIDQCFDFKAHIQFIKGKVARGIGKLNNAKKIFHFIHALDFILFFSLSIP